MVKKSTANAVGTTGGTGGDGFDRASLVCDDASILSLADGFDDVRRFLLEWDAKPESLKRYRSGLKMFVQYLLDRGVHGFDSLGVQDVVLYKNFLRESPALKTGHSRNMYLQSVKTFFSYRATLGKPNLASSIRRIASENVYGKESISVDQFHALLNSIDTVDFYGLRDYLLIVFLFTTGVRQMSVEDLRWDSFRLINVGGVLRLASTVRLKGRTERTKQVLISSRCMEALEALKAWHIKNSDGFAESWYLFSKDGLRPANCTIRLAVRTRLKKAGLWSKGMISGHSLRHGHAEYILESLGSVEDTAESLGHSNTVSTQFYINKINKKKVMAESSKYLDIL